MHNRFRSTGAAAMLATALLFSAPAAQAGDGSAETPVAPPATVGTAIAPSAPVGTAIAPSAPVGTAIAPSIPVGTIAPSAPVGTAIAPPAAPKPIGPAQRVANAMTTCPWSDKMVPGIIAKLPEQFKVRAVQLATGAAQISVVEGYRFPIAPEGQEIFANVKIEQSEAAKFDSDREAIIANIRWILSTSKDMETTEPLLVSMNGFEGPMINRAALSGTTLALIALFNEKEKLVLTIYLENAPPDKRAFSTKDEWNLLRDRFFIALTSCAAKALTP